MLSYNFPEITLLITHYNRSQSLERLLSTFQENRTLFGDIVVSDDGSDPVHLERVKSLHTNFAFSLITTPINKGLGNNINKGQERVKTPYTLYIQEDFIPNVTFASCLKDACDIMVREKNMDFIRFYSYLKYPYLKPFGKGFSEMVIKPFGLDYTKIYFYSDHPHLRRSNFLERFGKYKEGVKGDKTEYLMCLSVIQKKARGLFYDDYKALFEQKNSEEEPSTMHRSSWRQSRNLAVSVVRDVYRVVKYNYDIRCTKN